MFMLRYINRLESILFICLDKFCDQYYHSQYHLNCKISVWKKVINSVHKIDKFWLIDDVNLQNCGISTSYKVLYHLPTGEYSYLSHVIVISVPGKYYAVNKNK